MSTTTPAPQNKASNSPSLLAHRSWAAAAVTALALSLTAAPAASAQEPDYEAPTVDSVSADSAGHARVADGEGSQVAPGAEREIQIESPAHWADTPYELGDDLDVWIIPPEGEDGIYIDTFEVEEHENPEVYWSFLGPVVFDPELFDYSGVYALALMDSDGDMLVWQRTIVELDDDPIDLDAGPGGQASGTWDVPSTEHEQVTGAAPPTLDDLQPEEYGTLAIQEASPVIPLDREFVVELVGRNVSGEALWLLPPDGSDALELPMTATDDGTIDTIVNSDQVSFNGIYALALTAESGEVLWTPFGVVVDGDSIQPGDPGVNAEDTNTDRSIFPIPDSVPVPGANGDEETQTPSPSPTEEETESPTPEQTETPEDSTESPEATETDPTSETEDEGINPWVVVFAAVGGALVVAGITYAVATRRKST